MRREFLSTFIAGGVRWRSFKVKQGAKRLFHYVPAHSYEAVYSETKLKSAALIAESKKKMGCDSSRP